MLSAAFVVCMSVLASSLDGHRGGWRFRRRGPSWSDATDACEQPPRCYPPMTPSGHPPNHGADDERKSQGCCHALRRPYLRNRSAVMLAGRGGPMATRRRRLAQRRKAVGYTQEQL